jgi:anti-sigma B factor antagonist
MTYSHELAHGVLLLRVAGDLLGVPDEVQLMEVASLPAYEGVRGCVVDIAQVNYMNSSGLTVLIRLLTHFRNRDGEVVLVHPSAPVQKLLVITKLNAIFQVFDHQADALHFLLEPGVGQER